MVLNYCTYIRCLATFCLLLSPICPPYWSGSPAILPTLQIGTTGHAVHSQINEGEAITACRGLLSPYIFDGCLVSLAPKRKLQTALRCVTCSTYSVNNLLLFPRLSLVSWCEPSDGCYHALVVCLSTEFIVAGWLKSRLEITGRLPPVCIVSKVLRLKCLPREAWECLSIRPNRWCLASCWAMQPSQSACSSGVFFVQMWQT